ncbi:MAG: hypothetical protein OCD00_11295 [Colwellia sp.]
MGKHINQEDIENIINIIDEWGDLKLTWDNICKETHKKHSFLTTRQTLNDYSRVVDAYKSKKGILRNKKKKQPKPRAAQSYIDDNERLEAKNTRLEIENNRLKCQFMIWLYNASKHGLKIEQLNQPLPPVDKNSEESEV